MRRQLGKYVTRGDFVITVLAKDKPMRTLEELMEFDASGAPEMKDWVEEEGGLWEVCYGYLDRAELTELLHNPAELGCTLVAGIKEAMGEDE